MFSPKGFNGKLSEKNFQMRTNTFFSNSDINFYSENNNVSQVHLHNKNTKKNF
jgi:hypothetical protein